MTYLARLNGALAAAAALLITAQAAQAVPYAVDILGAPVTFETGGAPASIDGVSQLYLASPSAELGAADLFSAFFGVDDSITVNLDVPTADRPLLTYVAVTIDFGGISSTLITRIDGLAGDGSGPYLPDNDWNNLAIDFDSLTWNPITAATVESIALYGPRQSSPVPDNPVTLALLGIGLLGIGLVARQRRRSA
jgi:hypothetical protein